LRFLEREVLEDEIIELKKVEELLDSGTTD